jgi:hypothetical protein
MFLEFYEDLLSASKNLQLNMESFLDHGKRILQDIFSIFWSSYKHEIKGV